MKKLTALFLSLALLLVLCACGAPNASSGNASSGDAYASWGNASSGDAYASWGNASSGDAYASSGNATWNAFGIFGILLPHLNSNAVKLFACSSIRSISCLS